METRLQQKKSNSCWNCGKNQPRFQDEYGFCKFDDTRDFFEKEKKQDCPEWVPLAAQDKVFRAEVIRKVRQNAPIYDLLKEQICKEN